MQVYNWLAIIVVLINLHHAAAENGRWVYGGMGQSCDEVCHSMVPPALCQVTSMQNVNSELRFEVRYASTLNETIIRQLGAYSQAQEPYGPATDSSEVVAWGFFPFAIFGSEQTTCEAASPTFSRFCCCGDDDCFLGYEPRWIREGVSSPLPILHQTFEFVSLYFLQSNV